MPLALVTGATGGIGSAICNALARDGFDILMTARKPDALSTLASRLTSIYKARIVDWQAGDLSDENFINKLFEEKLTGKKLSVLVNNAGISAGDDIEKTSVSDWKLSLAVNLTAPFLLIQRAIPLMKDEGGSIVNIASLAAVQGAKKPSYAGSKTGLIGLTKSVALGAGKYNIRANAIVPGAVDTELIADWSEAKRASITEQIPLGHIGHPDEIADVVTFLASDRSRYVTGAILNVTGGAYLGA